MENSIRKQKLTVNLKSESDALLLRVRLPDINRESLLPIIERVLDELSIADQHITIDRLTIDLGTLPLNRFAEEAGHRLDTQLRSRLQDILTGEKHADTNLSREPVQQSRLHQFEHYLINGVLPWHTHNKSGFCCDALFLALAKDQKDSVVEVIVKHYRLPQVIERLVLQLRNDSLRKLLHLVEPHNAEVILAYIFDLEATHARTPVLPVDSSKFERLVWLLTLTYSVRERGTQFNRRSYLKSLIHGMAQREGLKYRELVIALHQGLKNIVKTRPLKSTLPALIAMLVEEKGFFDKNSPATAIDTTMMLRRLITDFPTDARQFLLDLHATPDLTNKAVDPFLENISTNEYERILCLAQPDMFNVSRTLAELITSIPVPYRPGRRRLRSVLLAQVLNSKPASIERFFTGVLRELFPTPLSKPLAMHLFKSAESSQGLDGLTEEQIAGFKSAINQCLSESLSERHKNHRVSASGEKNDQLREWQNRIFSALLPAQTLHLSKYAELKNLASIPREKLPSAINQLLVRSPDRLSTFVREHIDHQSIREYWIDILPESSLVRFIWLLEPQQLRSLLNSAETLSISHLQTNSSRSEGRRELWSFLLEFFADHSGSNCTLSALNASFFKQFPPGREASNGSIRNKNASSVAVHPRPKTDKTYQLASDEDKDQLLSPLNESQPTVLVGREEKKVMHPAMRSRFKLKDSSGTTRIEDCLYIDNAGLVLVGVFLPHLFKSLNMLHTNADGKIRLRDKATFSRGVHILQYLVTGSSSTSEPLLALNKIMCGESIHASVEPRIELAEEELRMCEQLQRAVLANWTSLSNTSITGLQETFFQREGRLVQMDDGWKLTVQRKTVDILMDQVSWSFSVISQAWMQETLYVSW